ncbi:uncharacterized protein EV422DRAFT_505704 [Fimicolochytrium jonesii]|uniref:uncharacterized protein n=1 Tax=Fimicolochytrium jonesii TaxID=1396493 RepID=UPI0022FED970|nr:uncharacterized protein EV422DRAFT_505704 [Fimicolochytrium jonesii]KAI8822218.1 hypothetical protein EV422DRAFT_505704 [Fimicolochytrium jonesii]
MDKPLLICQEEPLRNPRSLSAGRTTRLFTPAASNITPPFHTSQFAEVGQMRHHLEAYHTHLWGAFYLTLAILGGVFAGALKWQAQTEFTGEQVWIWLTLVGILLDFAPGLDSMLKAAGTPPNVVLRTQVEQQDLVAIHELGLGIHMTIKTRLSCGPGVIASLCIIGRHHLQ